MFLHNFLPKTLILLHFFLGGPLFCFLFFCFCSFKSFLSLGGPFLILLRPFCLSGAPFLIYTFFFSGHALSPKAGGPACFCTIFCQKRCFFTFFPRGPLVLVSCSFVFALLSLFLFLGCPFSYTFKAFLSLGGPFSYIYVFFPATPYAPKSGAPMFLHNFLPKTLILLHFFLGGPLFCFLFFCFCSFKAFLSLGGPFSYISNFFRPRPEPQSRGPRMFLHNFLPKTLFFLHFCRGGPLFLFLVLLFLLF